MWKQLPVPWTVDAAGTWSGYPGLAQANAAGDFAWALYQWQLVCGVRFEDAAALDARSDHLPAKVAPLIILTCERLPLRASIAAHSEIPDGSGKPVRCVLNAGVRWCFRTDPPAGFTDAAVVMLHEVGHLIGIRRHGPAGSVMFGEYAGVRQLQPWDVEAAVKLYGRRA